MDSASNSRGLLGSKWIIFAVTGLANLICGFSINSVNLALPSLAAEFGVAAGAVSWLSLVYSLIPCCSLLVFGRLGDLYGYRRQLLVGFLFFGVVSLLAPILASSLAVLILFRCLQGLGYSMLISITQAIVSRSFDASERGKALGVNSVFVSVGLAAGPTVGGFLLTRFGWHSIFYSNVPFCVLGAAAAFIVMKDEPRHGATKGRMDFLGAALFAASIGALAIGVNFSDDWGLASPPFLGCLAFCLLSLFLFARWELRVEAPLVPMRLFRQRTFSLANAACVCSYLTQQMTTFLVPFFLVGVLGLPADESGLIMLATPLAMMLSSPAGGAAADRYGTRRSALVGLAMIAAGCLFMSRLGVGASPLAVAGTLLLFGVGNGFSVSSINTAVLGAVPGSQAGIASGMVATMRNLGQTFGVAFGSVIVASREGFHAASKGLGKTDAYLLAQRDAFAFGLLVTVLAMALVSQLRASVERPTAV